MKKLAILTLATSALAIGGFAGIKGVKQSSEERDATIIVKMKTNIDNYSEKQLINIQDSLLNEISTKFTSNYKVTSRYTHVFNGFVLEIPSAYVSYIRSLSRVDKVNYNIFLAEETAGDGVSYEIPLVKNDATASSVTMEKPDGTNDGAGTFIAILDNGFYIEEKEDSTQVYHEVFSPLANEDAVITQSALKAKIDAAETFHGKYDETHTTYFNNKVPFYYDYGGDNQSVTKPDYNVYAESQDHGTHVASIAGGNAGASYEGIAPRAQMALMKVFRTYQVGSSYQSGAPADAILNGLEDCLILDVDTINMSLGTNLNDFDDGDIIEDTIRALEAKGTFVNVAAGNEGKGEYNDTVYRYWTTDMVETNIISSHANNMAAMTVASTQADYQFYGEAITVDGHNIQFTDQVVNYRSVDGDVTYNPERHLKEITNDGAIDEFDMVYLPGLGDISEYDDKDVTGKIVVTNRGELSFKEKVDNAASKGAIAILIIDNTSATELNIRMLFQNDDKTTYTPSIPVGFVLNKDKSVFAANTSGKCKFLLNVDLENPNTRTISSYSSDGMKYDLSIKPEISTPGENIKGAVLGETNKYESMSGTSMATPNYTGATALMIGEHLGDAAYRKTINARLMSTAQPMTDIVEENPTYASVRRQGAGLVNLDSAINSKVYLDGIDSEGQLLGKAKVELFNNDDIKEGKVKLSFAAINEGEATVTYTATTYVLAPATGEYDAEYYPDFAGQKFQSVYDQLVETFTDEITVPVGTTLINLPEHQVAETKLAALKEDFENGCILEGYTILSTEGQYQLSIPFLGFYGDLEDMSPVEPFAFEREEGKVYQSDITNYFANVAIGKNDDKDSGYDFTNADFSSQMVTGYWDGSASISNVVNNSTSITKMTDGNKNKVNLVGSNPFNGTLSKDELFVGNNGYSNTIVIQQHVLRSVFDNEVTLINKASGEVVATQHLYDPLYGSVYDASTGITTYPLFKSHVDLTGLFSNGYLAHRAYATIPLYTSEGSVRTAYPDGEYELKLHYDLMAGSSYEVSYTINIESNLPVIQGIEKVGSNYRFSYTDTNMAVLYVNEKPYAVTKSDDGVYVDVPETAFASSTKAIVKSVDKSFAQEFFYTHVDDKNCVMMYNVYFNSTYDFSYTVDGEGTNKQTFTFSITKNGKNGTTNGDIIYRMLVPEGLEIDSLKVISINGTGKEKEVKFTRIGNFIQFSSTIRLFRLESNGSSQGGGGDVTPPTPEPEKKGGCGGSLIAGSAIISIVSALGVTLLAIRRRKED